MITKIAVLAMMILGIVYFFMASVIIINTRSKHGYVYSGFFAALGFWSFADSYMTLSTEPFEAIFFVKMIALMWLYTFSFLTHTALLLSGTYKKISKKIMFLLIFMNYFLPASMLFFTFLIAPILPAHIECSPIGWFPSDEFFSQVRAFFLVISLIGIYILIWIYIYSKNRNTIHRRMNAKTARLLIASMVLMFISLAGINLSIPNLYFHALIPKLGVLIAVIPAYLFFNMLRQNNFSGIVSTGFVMDVIDRFDEGLILTNQFYSVTYANNASLKLTNSSDIIGKNLFEVIPMTFIKHLDENKSLETDMDGIHLYFSYTPFADAKNDIIGRVYSIRNITEVKNSQRMLEDMNKNLEAKIEKATKSLIETNENLRIEIDNRIEISKKMERSANYDSLTDILNRACFVRTVDDFLKGDRLSEDGASKKDCCSYLMYMDLNNFKTVNDTYGHTVGDEVLRVFSRKLKDVFDRDALIGRMGGDEFVVFLKFGVDRDLILKKCDELMSKLEMSLFVDDTNIPICPSIGIATYPYDADTLQILIRHADTAMYSAKTNETKYCFYDELEITRI